MGHSQKIRYRYATAYLYAESHLILSFISFLALSANYLLVLRST